MRTCPQCGAEIVRKKNEREHRFLVRTYCNRVCHNKHGAYLYHRTKVLRKGAIQRQVEERWGMCFWVLVASFAAQGLSRAKTSQALGYNDPSDFAKLLRENPDKDPFPTPSVIPVEYFRETGERFGDAVRRMAAAGYSLKQAAIEIGYKGIHQFKEAMAARNIDVKFSPHQRDLSRLPAMARHMNVTNCARALGFSCATRLREAMARQGLSIEFASETSIGRIKLEGEEHPWRTADKISFAKWQRDQLRSANKSTGE